MEDYKKKYQEIIKSIKESKKSMGGYTFSSVVDKIFPELEEESEDERIRKELIEFVHQYGDNYYGQISKASAISWLEKQGEKSNSVYDEKLSEILGSVMRRYINDPSIPYTEREKVSMEIIPYVERLEKQGEQKPADKIEPRFKVGDVVIWDGEEYTIQKVRENTYRVGGYDCPIYTQDEFTLKSSTKFNVGDFIVSDYCMGKVIELTDDAYLLDTGQGIPFSCEHNAHLWTIQDAKDGDVLATNNDDICIFDGTVEEGKYPFAYCGVTEHGFEFYDGKLPFTHANVQPATKEQRDLLFQKMEEAGYEWDGEKRELRKIEHEQNPADKSEVKFKGGDWIVNSKGETAHIIEVVSDFYGTLRYYIEWANGNKSDPTLCFVDNDFHLWTIKDAKDGDVLVASDGSIFLFAGVDDCACKYYAVLTNDNNIKINKEVKGGYWETSRAVHPATKEQRDLLFQKMKEEGYEWDSEKRELKIIDWSKHIKYEPNGPSITEKSADKVEPKFKVGDWVVSDIYSSALLHIIDNNDKIYEVETPQGNTEVPSIDYVDRNFHRWTLQDAKDGDVLAYNDGHGNDCIELIKSITDKKIEFWFCLTNGNDYEVFDGITPYTNFTSREKATPATKEQRDILMKAMTDAGYAFDFEKKELKKSAEML